MSTTITTTPTIGERAIITEYGYRTPATWVEECDRLGHGIMSHWCYDEPNPLRPEWTSKPNVGREPEPREWQAGDVVDHPKHGRGLVYDIGFGTPRVAWTGGTSSRLDGVAGDLTLVLAAPEPPKPDEPTGLGAVVRDRDDVLWVQVDGRDGISWCLAGDGDWSSWRAIDAVEILSEGVDL